MINLLLSINFEFKISFRVHKSLCYLEFKLHCFLRSFNLIIFLDVYIVFIIYAKIIKKVYIFKFKKSRII